MKIEISREELLSMVNKVSGVIPHAFSTERPLQNTALVEVEDGRVLLHGQGAEVYARIISKEAQVEGSFPSTCIPVQKKLLPILKQLDKNEPVILEHNGGRLFLKSGRATFILSVLPGAQYQKATELPYTHELKLSRIDFLQGLKRVVFAMGVGDHRANLNGCNLFINSEGVNLVAADSHRLSKATIAPAPFDEEVSIIIASKGVIEIIKVLQGIDDEEVTIRFSNSHLTVQSSHDLVISKLIPARFPDYRKMLKKTASSTCEFQVSAVYEILRRASILSEQRFLGVLFELEKDLLSITGKSVVELDKEKSITTTEESSDAVTIKYDGEPLEFGINASYVLDALEVMGTEHTRVELPGVNQFIVIRPIGEGASNSMHIISPMRLSSQNAYK